MTSELYWLTLTCLLTSAMWIPYILNRLAVRGMQRAMGNPRPDDLPHSAWADRAIRGHNNAVENLVVFAPAVIIVYLSGAASPTTAMLAMAFFFFRLAHYVVYIMGVPYLRTLIFAGGWMIQVTLLVIALQQAN